MMAGAANAALNIDLRATSLTGAGAITPGGKAVTAVTAGTVVNFDIFAVVTGSNAATSDDKFISVAGSFISGGGSTRGTLLADYIRTTEEPPVNGFDASGASVGLQQDLDGDGDLDVGSNNDSAANDFWAVRFQSTAGQSAGTNINGRKIGFGTFTVTNATGTTVVNFDGRNASTAANYFQDGAFISEASNDGAVGLNITGSGGGVTPEPATLSLAGLAGLAMVRRRRA
jgi:MYXO-CTERM domain-containing protein